MSDVHAIADRVEIEALRAGFTEASMMHDWDRSASLFTEYGAWRMPHINEELVSLVGIRGGVERLRSLWGYFVQNAHAGAIQLDGDNSTSTITCSIGVTPPQRRVLIQSGAQHLRGPLPRHHSTGRLPAPRSGGARQSGGAQTRLGLVGSARCSIH